MKKHIFALLAILISITVFFPIGSCKQGTKKTLRIWQTESDPNAKAAFERIIKKYETDHPGVTVQYEAISWDALSDKLTTAMASGDLPDLVHLQPFMVRSLQQKKLLEPLDDLIKSLGEDDIYPSVKNLQFFDGHYYGIAYAIGTTYFSYRKDWADQAGLKEPKTWEEYIQFVGKLQKDENGDGKIDRFGVDLPGGSPFFLEQLFGEMVASNGGRLFDDNGRPTFTEKPVLETLSFFASLSKLATPDWINETYADQFKTLAFGKVSSVPVTYARASKQIEKDAKQGTNDPEHFAVMEQPMGPSGKMSYSTIDCEPWCLMAKSSAKKEAKEFLQTFYQKENYLDFCLQVPIHLTPILKSVAESKEYLDNPFVKKWSSWQQMSLKMIKENRVNPIFLPQKSNAKLPFLMELQGSHILTDMIVDVCVKGKTPEAAAQEAQNKAEKLIETLGYKTW